MGTDVNEQIQQLKAEGRSLREIASVLGISHVAVLKRLRTMEGNRLVTSNDREKLPEIIDGKDDKLTRSNLYQSKLCHESKGGVNQVVTKKTPTSDIGENVNPLPRSRRGPCRAIRKDNLPYPDDLVGDLIRFLEGKGIEVYRTKSTQESYQVKCNGLTIRFYVQKDA